MAKWVIPVIIIGAGASAYMAYRKGLLGDLSALVGSVKKEFPLVTSPADLLTDPTEGDISSDGGSPETKDYIPTETPQQQPREPTRSSWSYPTVKEAEEFKVARKYLPTQT